MIKRVYGYYNNGPEIEFSLMEDGTWKTKIPSSEDGEYIVDVYAEDEAGNTSYYAAMLFIVKAHEIVSVRILSRYYANRLDKAYRAELLKPMYKLHRIKEMMN